MADTSVTPTTTTVGIITNMKEIDALDKLLFTGIIFFAIVLVAIARLMPNDGQTFQVISGLLTGFAGAFFGRMKPKGDTTKTPDTAVGAK